MVIKNKKTLVLIPYAKSSGGMTSARARAKVGLGWVAVIQGLSFLSFLQRPLLRKSSSAGISPSLGTPPGRTYLQRPLNFPAEPLPPGQSAPKLSKAASWTQGVSQGSRAEGVARGGGGVARVLKKDKKVRGDRILLPVFYSRATAVLFLINASFVAAV